jgi:hypothetical protein
MAQVSVTAQASEQELEQAPAQATALVSAMAQQRVNWNCRIQLPRIEWKRSRTR